MVEAINARYAVEVGASIPALRVLFELDDPKIAADIHNRKELLEELTNLTDHPSAHQDGLASATTLATRQATKGLLRQDLLK
jgi:hypothetical protein